MGLARVHVGLTATPALLTVTIEHGSAVDETGVNTMVVATPISISTQTTGAAALDTGTIAAGEYWVWLIANAGNTVVSGILSLSRSAPTMPATYTLKRRVARVTSTTAGVITIPDLDSVSDADELEEVLRSVLAGGGAALIGVEDSGTLLTATTVEAAIAEVAAEVDTNTADIATNVADIATAEADIVALQAQVWTIPVMGVWGIDVDGAETAGGGIVGDVLTLTEAGVALTKCDDGGVVVNLEDTTGAYTAAYQIYPDAPADNDAIMFGGAVPFCELAIDMSTVATYTGNGITWEYPTAQDTWATLTIIFDGSGTGALDGTRPFQRDGAVSFIPPTDWVSTTEDSQAGYWVRARVSTVANLAVIGITNSKQHEIVEPTTGWTAPAAATATLVQVCDFAGTLHTANDVKFILMDFTSGAHTAELTFAQDLSWESLTAALTVAQGDKLGVLVTAEDGTNEPTNVLLQVRVNVL